MSGQHRPLMRVWPCHSRTAAVWSALPSMLWPFLHRPLALPARTLRVPAYPYTAATIMADNTAAVAVSALAGGGIIRLAGLRRQSQHFCPPAGSHLVLTDQKKVELVPGPPASYGTVSLGHGDFDVNHAVETPAGRWVPAPGDGGQAEGFVNVAAEHRGARLSVSSSAWPERDDAAANQRAKNVLRLGASAGDPRWHCESNVCSFIWHHDDRDKWMVVDLGEERPLRRVGFVRRCRAEDDANCVVKTGTDMKWNSNTTEPDFGISFGRPSRERTAPGLEGSLTTWSAEGEAVRTSTETVVYFDRLQPARARYILFALPNTPGLVRHGQVFAWVKVDAKLRASADAHAVSAKAVLSGEVLEQTPAADVDEGGKRAPAGLAPLVLNVLPEIVTCFFSQLVARTFKK